MDSECMLDKDDHSSIPDRPPENGIGLTLEYESGDIRRLESPNLASRLPTRLPAELPEYPNCDLRSRGELTSPEQLN